MEKKYSFMKRRIQVVIAFFKNKKGFFPNAIVKFNYQMVLFDTLKNAPKIQMNSLLLNTNFTTPYIL
jgi:predicted YcjX-like family ATPase